jgi:hypothetical protein
MPNILTAPNCSIYELFFNWWFIICIPLSQNRIPRTKSNFTKFDQLNWKSVDIYNSKPILLDTSLKIFSYYVHLVVEFLYIICQIFKRFDFDQVKLLCILFWKEGGCMMLIGMKFLFLFLFFSYTIPNFLKGFLSKFGHLWTSY